MSAIEQTCDHPVRGEDPWDIVISPDGGRAYVVNRSTDNLFVIDLVSNRIVEVLDLYPEADHPLGPAPTSVAITPDGGRLLVTNVHDGSVTVIDTATNSVVETLAVGQAPVDVAISPDGSLAYVPNKYDWTTTVIDLVATDVLTTINVPDGGGPFAAAFAPDGSRAYVAMQDAPVYVVDPATHTITDTILVTNAGWRGDLVISSDGNTGYLAALTGDEVTVLDLVSRSVADAFEVVNPEGLALSADGSRLFVGTFGFMGESDYNLWMFDTQSGEVVAGLNFEHPGAPRLVGSDIQGLALTPDGSRLYAPSIDGESVFIVDAATLEQLDIILTNPIPSFAPFRGVISPDGAYLYIASSVLRPTTVSVIDTATQRVVGEIVSDRDGRCASPSWGLDVSPDGKTLYVLSSDGRCVLVADTQSRDIVDSFQLPVSGDDWLTHIAVHPDGDKAYVLDHAGDVSVIDLESQDVITTVATTDGCSVLKLSPDGQRGYVICNADFSVLDLATDTLLETITIGDGGSFFEWLYYLGIRPDSSQYVIGAFFDMYLYDAASDAQIRDIDLDALSPTWLTLGQDFVFGPDGSTGYLAMPNENAVAVFDTDTWQLTAQIDTGRAPYFATEPVWLLLDPDGSTLYVVNELSDNVLVIDTATNQVTGVISLRKCRVYLPLTVRQWRPTIVKVVPVSSSVSIGEDFAISVLIDNAADLGAYELHMDFDPAVVHARSVEDGGFLGSGGRSVLPLGVQIDNDIGTLVFGALSLGPGEGATGTGVLATVSLEAVGAGRSPLTLDSVAILDTAGESPAVAVQDGSVTVTE
jgi:YVTN family beta-propeller protein